MASDGQVGLFHPYKWSYGPLLTIGDGARGYLPRTGLHEIITSETLEDFEVESVFFSGGDPCFSLEIHQIPSLKLASWESQRTPAMPPRPRNKALLRDY